LLEEEGINVEANKESLCFTVKLVALKQSWAGVTKKGPPQRCSEIRCPNEMHDWDIGRKSLWRHKLQEDSRKKRKRKT